MSKLRLEKKHKSKMKIENKEGLGSKPPQMEENTGMKQAEQFF